MEAINYANGANMTLPADAQIVQGVSGNAVYLPAGAGTMPIADNRNELTISLWRQWDGVVEADDYRGVFKTANINVYFDQATDFLTVELAGTKTVTETKDDQALAHWCFLFSKNGFFKIYKNAELKAELATGNYPVDFSEGFTLGGGRTHATFDEVRMYKTVVTEPEIMGLYRLVTKGTQVQQLENIVAEAAPKYLGVVETVPDTKTAIITKGEKFGFVDANPGDWVLSGKTIGGWKVGVCYKWSGLAWKPLEPAINYAKEYHACLVHLFEIEELKQQTGHFGALFAKILVAQKAMIDELLVNQAFIKNLVVRKLKIDTDETTNQDFEAWFDELNGLRIRNKGEEIFQIDTNGDVFAKNAFLQDGAFTGEIITDSFELRKASPDELGLLLNTPQNTKASVIYNSFTETITAECVIIYNGKKRKVEYISKDNGTEDEVGHFQDGGLVIYNKYTYKVFFKLSNPLETITFSFGYYKNYVLINGGDSTWSKPYDHWDDSIPFEIKAYELGRPNRIMVFKKISKGQGMNSGTVYCHEKEGRKYLCIT